MPNLVKNFFGTLTNLTVTNLHSLADANWWQSGEVNDANPANEAVEIWWTIVFNATPVAGDFLWFKMAFGNDDSTEIWDGGIGTTEGQITFAGPKAELEQAPMPQRTHYWVANHGTTFKGHSVFPLLAPTWQILISPKGEALSASGNVVKYRYRTSRIEATA